MFCCDSEIFVNPAWSVILAHCHFDIALLPPWPVSHALSSMHILFAPFLFVLLLFRFRFIIVKAGFFLAELKWVDFLRPFFWLAPHDRREIGRNVTSFQAWPLWPATWVGYELGGSAPHECRWAGCCLFAALSWLCVGCSGFGRFFHWPLVSSWTVNLIIFGLGFLGARLLQLCWTAVCPPIFLQLRKGP